MTLQTTSKIEFFAPGIPRPGGSKKGFYNAKLGRVMIVKAGGQNEENWRQAVSYAAMRAMGDELPWPGGVRLVVLFIMPRPKYHYHTVKACRGELKAEWAINPCPHIKEPDLDKMMRSTKDAMTKIVYVDDCQVWDEPARKVYGERPGAHIKVVFGTAGLDVETFKLEREPLFGERE